MRIERLLLLATVAAGIIFSVLYFRAAGDNARLYRQNAELKVATGKAEELRKAAEEERDTLRAAHEVFAEAAPAAPAPRRDSSTPTDATARLDLIRTLGETRQRLTAANATIEDLQHSVAEFESRLAELTQQTRMMTKSESDLKDHLDTQTRLVAALQAELKIRAGRLLEAETANVQLRQRREDVAAKLAPLLQPISEMEELNRRREVYLNSILRRYREVTDLYRNLALRADNPSGDIARIQNAISLADEDLKQIQSLNAQTERLQRKLTTARQEALKR